MKYKNNFTKLLKPGFSINNDNVIYEIINLIEMLKIRNKIVEVYWIDHSTFKSDNELDSLAEEIVETSIPVNFSIYKITLIIYKINYSIIFILLSQSFFMKWFA